MSESSDYTPGKWAGHDFANARKSYDSTAGRSYTTAIQSGVTASQLVPDSISTDSDESLIIMCDVTGSMGGWPGTIFSKLPYLEHEVTTEYLSPNAAVCFAAISDTGDEYPFQIQPFARGTDMKRNMDNLHLTEGGSGPGSYCEAYGIAALYALHNISMPQAQKKPILIIIGDEKPYGLISQSDAAEYAKVKIPGRLSAEHIFEELQKKYSVYLVLKPYGNESFHGDTLTGVTATIYDHWVGILGAGRIALLADAGRVVDVIFGILAQDRDHVDYFRREIEGRQQPDQVDTVYQSLKTIHGIPKGTALPALSAGGKSVMIAPDDNAPRTKRLV
jgi:hypothetical protein